MAPSSDQNANGKREEWVVTDLIKKALVAGVGTLFMTEEGIRSFLGDMKLPKEGVQFLVNQVAKTKQDLFNSISSELRSFLESTNLADEMRRVLTSTSVEVSTKISFVANENATRPRVKSRVKVKKKSPKAATRKEPKQ